jgi:hypothetical protein
MTPAIPVALSYSPDWNGNEDRNWNVTDATDAVACHENIANAISNMHGRIVTLERYNRARDYQIEALRTQFNATTTIPLNASAKLTKSHINALAALLATDDAFETMSMETRKTVNNILGRTDETIAPWNEKLDMSEYDQHVLWTALCINPYTSATAKQDDNNEDYVEASEPVETPVETPIEACVDAVAEACAEACTEACAEACTEACTEVGTAATVNAEPVDATAAESDAVSACADAAVDEAPAEAVVDNVAEAAAANPEPTATDTPEPDDSANAV